MGTYKIRVCEVCSHDYQPAYPAQRTCGRVCGVTLRRREHGTASSRPPGRACKRCGKHHLSLNGDNRTCDDCRGPVDRLCDVCGKQFSTPAARRKRCSDGCARAALIRSITSRYRADPAFRDKVITAAQNRRADKLGSPQITTQAQLTAYLIRRDHSRCGICRKPVRAVRGPMRPSIDHIVPLSAGGRHELANLQLAHYRCNLSKGNRGHGEQLLLVG